MKKAIIITFILLFMANPAFCGGPVYIPQPIDLIGPAMRVKQMELQEREMRLKEKEQQERLQHNKDTNFRCYEDCLNAQHSFGFCKKACYPEE
jgi:hypothetical protein